MHKCTNALQGRSEMKWKQTKTSKKHPDRIWKLWVQARMQRWPEYSNSAVVRCSGSGTSSLPFQIQLESHSHSKTGPVPRPMPIQVHENAKAKRSTRRTVVVVVAKILKHAQLLCQFYEVRKLNMRTGVEGCVFVAWFGQYTDFAFLVSLFGFAQPIPSGSPW